MATLRLSCGPGEKVRPTSNNAVSMFWRARLLRSESNRPGNKLGRSTFMSLESGYSKFTQASAASSADLSLIKVCP